MTTRTPPSIAWLAKKYCKAKLELRKVEKDLASLLLKRDALRADIDSLDRVICLHEVPILASDIAINNKATRRNNLKHGCITSAILRHLNTLPTGEDSSVSEIFYALVKLLRLDFETESDYLRFRSSVGQQCRNLCNRGRILRTYKGTGHQPSRYRAFMKDEQLMWDFSTGE